MSIQDQEKMFGIIMGSVMALVILGFITFGNWKLLLLVAVFDILVGAIAFFIPSKMPASVTASIHAAIMIIASLFGALASILIIYLPLGPY